MHHIVYISSATKNFSGLELSDLLKICRIHNHQHQITGFLMYYDLRFFQVIEGDKSRVEDCFATISKDSRHREVHVLKNESSERRVFENWDMGLVGFHDLACEDQTKFLKLSDLCLREKGKELQSDATISVFARAFLHDLNRFR